MTSKYLNPILILMTVFYACSDWTPDARVRGGITILNTGPRGGGYIDPAGKDFGYRIFRAQVKNDSTLPVELTVNFPGGLLPLLPDSSKHLSVFLFPDEMTPDEVEDIYNFGITGLEPFLDKGFNRPSMLKKTIQPGEDHILCIGVLFDPEGLNGLGRAKLFINGEDVDAPFLPVKSIETGTKNENELDLIFGVAIDPPQYYSLIPCGKLAFTTH